MDVIAFVVVATLVLGGSILCGVLAQSRETPLHQPPPDPDFDRHWSQAADLFTPEEDKPWN